MSITIQIRRYRPGDGPGVVAAYRDSLNALRVSAGGVHPDAEIETIQSQPDADLERYLVSGGVLLVAEVAETGEIAGLGGIGTLLVYRLFGVAYSQKLAVKRRFQRGQAGVRVGSLLRQAMIDEARQRGCRKLFGYATREAVRFHASHGMRFRPEYDRVLGHSSVPACYYEYPLRPSLWNRVPIEPRLYWSYVWCDQFRHRLRHAAQRRLGKLLR